MAKLNSRAKAELVKRRIELRTELNGLENSIYSYLHLIERSELNKLDRNYLELSESRKTGIENQIDSCVATYVNFEIEMEDLEEKLKAK